VPIRYDIDADLLGLARLLVSVRADLTYPGDTGGKGIDGRTRGPCPISTDSKDADWIPEVARRGWIVISRDQHLPSRPAERAAILEAGGRHLILNSKQALNKWGQLEIVMCRWRSIEPLVELPGPWAYVVSRTVLSKIIL
jgi:PIN like domain